MLGKREVFGIPPIQLLPRNTIEPPFFSVTFFFTNERIRAGFVRYVPKIKYEFSRDKLLPIDIVAPFRNSRVSREFREQRRLTMGRKREHCCLVDIFAEETNRVYSLIVEDSSEGSFCFRRQQHRIAQT